MVIVAENFDAGVTGWGGNVTAAAGEMRIPRDQSAVKTFDFGLAQANQTVTVDFDLTTTGGWENGVNWTDFFEIRANGTLISNNSYPDTTTHVTIDVTLDANGQVILDMMPNTTGNTEEALIDNFTISQPVGTDELIDSFTYAVDDRDGFSDTALLNVTIHDIATDHEVIGTPSADEITGTADADYLTGLAGNDTITGGAGDDVLLGGEGADLLIGGEGDDYLIGGAGVDIFALENNDQGIDGSPAVDTIADFSTGSGGDVLDLSDMLQGEESESLDGFLNFSYDSGTGDTTISVDASGGVGNGVTQQIVLTGVDLTANGTLTDQQILDNLLSNGNLIVDQ